MVTRTSDIHSRTQQRAGWLSLSIAILLLIIKTSAYLITSSAAILSDALESIVHIIPTVFTLFSLYLSAKPADDNHLYGHGKIESVAAIIEATAILMAAIGIFYSAIDKMIRGTALHSMGTGLGLLLLAMLINLVLGLYLIRLGRRTSSLALESNGRHIMTDVVTSAGVAVGIIFILFFDIPIIDPIIACIVALQIIFTAIAIYRKAIMGIMDERLAQDDERITAILNRHLHTAICDYHRLRHRRSGNQVQVDFHCHLPASYSLQHAHDVATQIEHDIATQFDASVVISHIEPCTLDNCPTCKVLKSIE